MEYKGNGRVTQKGESSRDQEEDVKPERQGDRRQGYQSVSERERDQRRQGQEDRVERRGERKQGGQGRGGRGVRQGRGEKRKQERRKNREEGREEGRGESGRVETDTEANVSPNMGTLKTNLRYSGNWGHWNLQRKQTKITVGREQSTVTLCWSPGSAGAVGERQEEGTQMGQ